VAVPRIRWKTVVAPEFVAPSGETMQIACLSSAEEFAVATGGIQ